MPPAGQPRVPGTVCAVPVCGEGETVEVPGGGQSVGLLPLEATGGLRTKQALGRKR